MEKHYPSKRDGWIAALLLGSACVDVLVILWVLGQADDPIMITVVTLAVLPVALLTLWLLVGTGYVVTRTELIARAGPFRWRVPLASITSVEHTRAPLSAPALSLDRLRIRYGDSRVLLVSPADQRGFLGAIGRAGV